MITFKDLHDEVMNKVKEIEKKQLELETKINKIILNTKVKQ